MNVLNSIADDKLHRSADVKDFINMLETIDYNAFISLDAAWGEGKTFFVRQAEMTLSASLLHIFRTQCLLLVPLDRCRPSYAIEMLERIKHYFDDDRIVFVMSVNKAQLVHTISNCYGDGFDSSDYLNKFFDISLQLPPVDTTLHIHSMLCNFHRT